MHRQRGHAWRTNRTPASASASALPRAARLIGVGVFLHADAAISYAAAGAVRLARRVEHGVRNERGRQGRAPDTHQRLKGATSC